MHNALSDPTYIPKLNDFVNKLVQRAGYLPHIVYFSTFSYLKSIGWSTTFRANFSKPTLSNKIRKISLAWRAIYRTYCY